MATSGPRVNTAKSRNNRPCVHCRRNRQRCEGGYPCYFCTKFHRQGCIPVQTSSIKVTESPTTDASPVNVETENSPEIPNAADQTRQNSSSSQFIGHYGHDAHGATELQSSGFNQMKLLGPFGEVTGFIESFVHTYNGRLYYGARYYDPDRTLIKEDLLLSRVSENDGLQFITVTSPDYPSGDFDPNSNSPNCFPWESPNESDNSLSAH